MNDLFLTLGGLIASLGNVQSVSVVKEHLALVNTQLGLLKEQVEKLEKENSDLIQRHRDLVQEIDRQKTSKEFVESRGALFKRIAGGAYDQTPICPNCKRTMFCLRHTLPYVCTNKSCEHVSDFKGNQLQDVIAGLPKLEDQK